MTFQFPNHIFWYLCLNETYLDKITVVVVKILNIGLKELVLNYKTDLKFKFVAHSAFTANHGPDAFAFNRVNIHNFDRPNHTRKLFAN